MLVLYFQDPMCPAVVAHASLEASPSSPSFVFFFHTLSFSPQLAARERALRAKLQRLRPRCGIALNQLFSFFPAVGSKKADTILPSELTSCFPPLTFAPATFRCIFVSKHKHRANTLAPSLTVSHRVVISKPIASPGKWCQVLPISTVSFWTSAANWASWFRGIFQTKLAQT